MVITSAGHYLSGAIEALKEKDPHAKIAMVYSADPFSKSVLAAAKEQAELEVVMDESYAPSTTDFGPVVNKIISSNADTFMGGGHYSDGATLARQMYDQKANLKWISILVALADDKFAELGAAALGVTVPSQWSFRSTTSRNSRLPTHARAERGLALVPEGRQLISTMTVDENLELGAFSRHATMAFAFETFLLCFPALASGGDRSPARCQAASSRCWPLRAA
ncbi:ABC transporter substrate-binding protein [Bradyrhizobium sp. ISRA464]|nr:ABC transporter substrate-binding protein [Bradyrhizobium sp. ISRA463]WGS27501.1 ABC transporter substrate-binding protein [Bradyrhizobium sp. ISRA464]